MRLNSALLDLDGTLLDTLGDFTVSLNAMLADLKLPTLSEEQVETLIGRGSEHLIRGALTLHCPDLSGDELDQRQAEGWRLYQAHYRAHNGLHSTNKPAEFARELLRKKGLDHFFEQVTGGDSHPRKKPDPMPLLKTCEALQTNPQRTLMIGDSIHDAHAAQAAGCPLVLVTYGYHHGADLTALGAVQTVARLDEISGHRF